MLDINSLDLSQLKTTLTTVTSQIALYKTYINSASKLYGNVMSKINSVKTGFNIAKQTLENAKSNIKNKKVESPIPENLMTVENTNTDVATNNIELACMQITKEESSKKVDKYMNLVSELELWKSKLEQKIFALEQKAAENTIISNGKGLISKIQSTVNNSQKEADTLITKSTNVTGKVETTINKTNLTKVI